MEITPDTSSTQLKADKRARTRSKVVKDPADSRPAAKAPSAVKAPPAIKTQSAGVRKPRAPRKTPTAEVTPSALADAPVVAASLEPSAQDVGTMIATAAYYLAAERNFTPGHELEDWLAAERTIHAMLYG